MSRLRMSWSQINLLNRCGEAYRRRYVLGEKIPPGIAMAVGTATDKSVTRDLTEKKDTGSLLPDDVISDIARDALLSAWGDGVALSEDERTVGEAKLKGEAVDKSVRLSELHHGAQAPLIEPVHLQREIRIESPSRDLEILGYIDIQEPDAVRDTKTSGKSPAAGMIETADQLTLYALGVKVIDGKAPAKVHLDYLVDTKQPKVVTLEATRDEGHFRALLARIDNAAESVRAGVFVPVSQDHWMCSPRWCGYYSTCRYVRRPALVALEVA